MALFDSIDDGQKEDFVHILIIMVIGIFLRFLVITRDIFTDEAYSYLYSLKPISFIIGINDVHPPLYYLYLKPFAAIWGNNLIMLRDSTLILWFFAFWAIYALLVRLWNIKVAKYALLLLSLSPTMIYYSTELRMYMLGMLFIVLSFIAYYNLISKSSPKNIFFFALTILLMGFTHFLTMPIVAFQFGYAAYKNQFDRRFLLPFFCLLGVSTYAFFTNLKVTSLHFVKPTLTSLISTYTFMWSYPHKNMPIFIIALGFLIAGLIYYKAKLPDEKAWLFLSLCIVPIGFFILSQFFVIYHHRFFLLEALGAYIFIGYALWRLKIASKNDFHYAPLAVFILASLFVINCPSDYITYNNYDSLKNLSNASLITDNAFDFYVERFYTENRNVSVYLNTTLSKEELFSYGGNILNMSDYYEENGQRYYVAGYILII